MSFEIMLLILLGAALHAIWNAAVKSGKDKFVDTALVLFGTVLIIPPILCFLPLPAAACCPYFVASIGIHVLYFLLVSLSYTHGDMSVVYPLMRGSAPAVTALLGTIFLKEMPSQLGWLGILFVSGGILSLAIGHFGAGQKQNKGVMFALLNAAVIVIYTLVDGAGVRLSGNALSYTGWMILVTAFIVIGWTLWSRGVATRDYLFRNWAKGLLGGSCTFGSYTLALWAMTRAPVALVAAMRETSIVFGTILAVVILKEKVSRQRLLAIAAVATGAVLIKLS
jgi:drug/metabolite transporter (DMT)-like permease